MYNGVSQTKKELVGNYINKDKVKINVIDVQQQENASDCDVVYVYTETTLKTNYSTTHFLTINTKYLLHNQTYSSLLVSTECTCRTNERCSARTGNLGRDPLGR